MQSVARARLNKLHRDKPQEQLKLAEWVHRLTPRYSPPYHLAPLLEKIERAIRGEQIKIVVHTPPRHGKTETLLHAIPYGLQQFPYLRFGYMTYQATLACEKSATALDIALRAGVQIKSYNTANWITTAGGGCRAVGVRGALIGTGLDIAIIDDPIKNRMEAESPLMRDRILTWFRDVVYTRIENGSCIINMARWHPDDLAGTVLKELTDQGWEEIHLPALADGPLGEQTVALWPERWPVKALLEKRGTVGEYTWNSQYQGRPRGRGQAVFGDPKSWTRLPANYTAAQGLDLAYVKGRVQDHSVVVTIYREDNAWVDPKDPTNVKHLYYIVRVRREQCKAPEFQRIARVENDLQRRCRMRIYGSGPEIGSIDFFRVGDHAIRTLEVLPPKGDKFVRAMEYAAAWNEGRILVPSAGNVKRGSEEDDALAAFLAEHLTFTGVSDLHDDTVDASVAAFDVLNVERMGKGTHFKKPPMPSRSAGL